MEDPHIPPPSPSPPSESGPTIDGVVQSAFPLVDDSTDAPKPDQERAIHIESSEVYASALQRDWEAVAALGMAMDVKVSIVVLDSVQRTDGSSVASTLVVSVEGRT